MSSDLPSVAGSSSPSPAPPPSFARQVLEPLCDATKDLFRPLPLQKRDHLVVWLDNEGKKLLAEIKALVPAVDDSRVEETGDDGRKFEVWGAPSWDSSAFWDRVPECDAYDRRGSDYKMRNVRKLGATDTTSIIIKELWPADRIVYRSRHARLTVEYLYARFQAQTICAEAVAKFKALGIVPEVPEKYRPFYKLHPNPKLRLSDYQQAACNVSLGRENYALFMDPGTGKTATTVQRICTEAGHVRATKNRMMMVLVVCPPQVRKNWQEEISRFSTCAGKSVVCRGGQIKRVRLLTRAIAAEEGCDYGVAIIGYDSFVKSVDVFKRVPWDLVVCDESHKFKSHTTDRYTALAQIVELTGSRQILTGTPIGNRYTDLFSQLEFIGTGLSGFSNWANFRSYFGVYEPAANQKGVEKLVGMRNVPLLQERLARLSFQITKEEAGLNLPDKVPQVIEVQMTGAQAEWYRKIGEELAIEIEEALSGAVDSMVIENVLTKLLRLAQITSGHVGFPAVRDEEGNVVKPAKVMRIPGPNPKIEALLEMLTDEGEDPNAKTVVWATWREDIHHISEALTKAGIKHEVYYGGTPMNVRDDIVWRFNNDPEHRVLVCNAATAGEGLNLLGHNPDKPEMPTYCDRTVFFSQNWSTIARAQAEERVHRRGTKMPVRVVDMVVPGSIDEEIRSRVTEKRAMAKAITDVREILASVLEASAVSGETA